MNIVTEEMRQDILAEARFYGETRVFWFEINGFIDFGYNRYSFGWEYEPFWIDKV